MSKDMQGKVALVTGAGGGLGRATSLAFADRGAAVAVVDVDEDGGAETVRLIEQEGGQAAFISCDVTDEEAVEAMVGSVVDQLGGLDYAYNNAGTEGKQSPLAEMDSDEFRRVVELNLYGVFYCMKAQLRHMVDHGGGVIVNTSSTAGLRGYPQLAPYAASKHGVVGLTKAAALEYADQGIRIVSVHPAAIETAMIARAIEDNPELEESIAGPMGRIGQPREVADVVVFLCSDGASFLTGGQYVIDGGLLSAG